ncbi:MotA/TolQ/ExbB proton channel family protein [Candidatus Marithrix sp. Canyon 246]|uniref:MotA/TolQ/ExbB proton channel family protein n=1 Tax=Candidatus Marithrix sp. Canyon 246 TaxID=1827136 RepID=UPI000849EEA1|nr:MotA/TolQ/ExbB proton channel family protein [Candidatus Marithrix sp. Canyon 246]
MFEIISSGGIVIWPIILCSIIVMAIIGERFWALRKDVIIPKTLVAQVWKWMDEGKLDNQRLVFLRKHSLLGYILASGLVHRTRSKMKSSMEDAGRQVVPKLEKHLNILGTIAEIAPLLGLLGTISGMIKMFTAIGEVGLGNPLVLSTGISEALITTAAGLIVAIPAFIFYRYFRAKVDHLTLSMEQEAVRLIELLDAERRS